MPRFDYDPVEGKVVENLNYRAQYNDSMPWTQAEYENWPGNIEDLYKKYNVKLSDLPTDRSIIHIAATKSSPTTFPTQTKFRESHYLDEVRDYIAGTYGEHYAKGDVQTFELIASSGHADGFCMGSIQKYAARYGKKGGHNRKDLLKIIHYALLQLWVHDNADRD